MSADLSKLIFSSSANTFKNDNAVYLGSISFPTSVLASSTASTTTTVTLPESPVFSKFFAFYKEYYDARLGTGSAQWYSSSMPGLGGIPVDITAPSAQAGWINAWLYPVINGRILTVTALISNPYALNITVAALSVPFAFVEYTLAN